MVLAASGSAVPPLADRVLLRGVRGSALCLDPLASEVRTEFVGGVLATVVRTKLANGPVVLARDVHFKLLECREGLRLVPQEIHPRPPRVIVSKGLEVIRTATGSNVDRSGHV